MFPLIAQFNPQNVSLHFLRIIFSELLGMSMQKYYRVIHAFVKKHTKTNLVGVPSVPSAVIKCQFCYWSNHVIYVIKRYLMSLSVNFIIGQILSFYVRSCHHVS
jgi:hypothetical protein